MPMRKQPHPFIHGGMLAALPIASLFFVTSAQAATTLLSGGDVALVAGWDNGLPTDTGANDGIVTVNNGIWSSTTALNNANVTIASGGKVVTSNPTGGLAFGGTGAVSTLTVQNGGQLDLLTGRTTGAIDFNNTTRLVVDAGGVAQINAVRFRSSSTSVINGSLTFGATDNRIITTGTFLSIGSTGTVWFQLLDNTNASWDWGTGEIVDFAGSGGSLTISNLGNLAYYQSRWDTDRLTYNGQNKTALGGADFSNYFSVSNTTLTAVPEPGSLILLGAAGAVFTFKRRRRESF